MKRVKIKSSFTIMTNPNDCIIDIDRYLKEDIKKMEMLMRDNRIDEFIIEIDDPHIESVLLEEYKKNIHNGWLNNHKSNLQRIIIHKFNGSSYVALQPLQKQNTIVDRY